MKLYWEGDDSLLKEKFKYEAYIDCDQICTKSIEKPKYFNLKDYDLIELKDLFNLGDYLYNLIGIDGKFYFNLSYFRAILREVKYDMNIDIYYPRREAPLIIATDEWFYAIAPRER